MVREENWINSQHFVGLFFCIIFFFLLRKEAYAFLSLNQLLGYCIFWVESTRFFLSWSSLVFCFNGMNSRLALLHSCHPGTSFSFHSWIISTVPCVLALTLLVFLLVAREYPQVMPLHVWTCLFSAFLLDGSFEYKNLGHNYFTLEISETLLSLLQLRVSDFSQRLNFSLHFCFFLKSLRIFSWWLYNFHRIRLDVFSWNRR